MTNIEQPTEVDDLTPEQVAAERKQVAAENERDAWADREAERRAAEDEREDDGYEGEDINW